VYGGEAGVQIAERLFQVSSELALEIIAEADRTDVEPRIPLALLMMTATAEIWLVAEQPAFWDRYATFWSGGDEAAAIRWRESLRTGAVRRERVVREHCSAIISDERIRRLVDRYRAALQEAFYAYQADLPKLDQESLCSQFIHLMNNRLGIFPFEEAYMALLAAQLS
jgi:thiopeptide-type bacteriocin biosynthesis protein